MRCRQAHQRPMSRPAGPPTERIWGFSIWERHCSRMREPLPRASLAHKRCARSERRQRCLRVNPRGQLVTSAQRVLLHGEAGCCLQALPVVTAAQVCTHLNIVPKNCKRVLQGTHPLHRRVLARIHLHMHRLSSAELHCILLSCCAYRTTPSVQA